MPPRDSDTVIQELHITFDHTILNSSGASSTAIVTFTCRNWGAYIIFRFSPGSRDCPLDVSLSQSLTLICICSPAAQHTRHHVHSSAHPLTLQGTQPNPPCQPKSTRDDPSHPPFRFPLLPSAISKITLALPSSNPDIHGVIISSTTDSY